MCFTRQSQDDARHIIGLRNFRGWAREAWRTGGLSHEFRLRSLPFEDTSMLIFRIASSCHGVTIYGSFNFVCDWHDFLMFRQLTLNCTVAMLSTCIMQQQVWKCCYTVITKKIADAKLQLHRHAVGDEVLCGRPPHLTQYRSCGVKSVAGESDREEQ